MDEGHLLAGRYRLVQRIGSGAMGVVWQGHDEVLDRPVAVKKLLLRPGLPQAKADEAVARCLREGRIAARLHHPNAITVFDVVDEDGVPNLVMEYLPSRSLAAMIAEEGPMAPADVAAIGAHVANALAAAHEAGIVHRDITPGNVLLGEDGAVKLTDFGISRAADDAAATTSGPFAGTPAFLAPEVAHGANPTPASDVFSLGATLYAAIEGQPPFGRATNVLALLHTVAGGEINPPQRSGPLTDLLLALLATDPDLRPTAEQAHDQLTAAFEATPDDTEVVAAAPAPDSRSRTPLAAAGVLVVALAAVGLWLLGSHNSMTPGRDRDPADGIGHDSHTTRTTGTAPPMTRVGDPIDADHKRPARRPASHGAAAPVTSGADTGAPDPNRETAPPVTTTTDQADDPTTSDVTTTPPPSSEEATTEPADGQSG